MSAHFVYRCYDADGVLLYVGCTGNVKRRLAAHRKGSGTSKASRWLSATMASYEVAGPFAGLEAGRAAERDAIRYEQPLFNMQERGISGWMHIPDIAAYLVARGHQRLAIETACTCHPEEIEGVIYTYRCEAHQADSAELRVAS